jgi:hypothetical protein
MSDTKMLAKAVLKELIQYGKVSLCEWINEEKVLLEFPFTKSQLMGFRQDNKLERGFHYKSIGIDESKDGSRRGRKTIIYHRNRLIDFVDSL